MRVALTTLGSLALLFGVFLDVIGVALMIAGGTYLDSDFSLRSFGLVLIVLGLVLAIPSILVLRSLWLRRKARQEAAKGA